MPVASFFLNMILIFEVFFFNWFELGLTTVFYMNRGHSKSTNINEEILSSIFLSVKCTAESILIFLDGHILYCGSDQQIDRNVKNV